MCYACIYVVCILLVLSLENGLAFVGIDTTKYPEEQVDKLIHSAEFMIWALFKVPIAREMLMRVKFAS